MTKGSSLGGGRDGRGGGRDDPRNKRPQRGGSVAGGSSGGANEDGWTEISSRNRAPFEKIDASRIRNIGQGLIKVGATKFAGKTPNSAFCLASNSLCIPHAGQATFVFLTFVCFAPLL